MKQDFQGNEGSFQKKSRFNQERDSYISQEGDVVYLEWEQQTNGKWVRVERCRVPFAQLQEKGLTQLVIDLDEFNHQWDLAERYNEEEADYRFRNMMLKRDRQEESDDDECFDNEPDISNPNADVFERLFPDPKDKDPRLDKVNEFLEQLTQQQRDLFFLHLGAQMQLEEIRRDEIARTGKAITQQAMADRWRKIMDRAYKFFGVEKPKKRKS